MMGANIGQKETMEGLFLMFDPIKRVLNVGPLLIPK